MAAAPHKVLFLCTGNSARSIMAEAILSRLGAGRFRAFSAGSHPKGEIHPITLQVLHEHGHDIRELRSKSWDEFAIAGAPLLDFVFTVCDDAAGETCPIWPGQPISAHWGVEDPAAYKGTVEDQRWVFRQVYQILERRIDLFTNLSLEALDRISLQRQVTEIGKAGRSDEGPRGR